MTPEDSAAADNGDTGSEANPPERLGELPGMDMVRRVLEEARGAARSQGKDVGRGWVSPARRTPVTGRRRAWSGPGPDVRDPQPLAAATRDLARSRGWSKQVAEGAVLGQWTTVVGEQIADHAVPVNLREGVLTIAAESTAWATQLRMVQAQILAKIAGAVGDGIVTSVKIQGPTAPSWRKGKLNVPGRGPRDTYG